MAALAVTARRTNRTAARETRRPKLVIVPAAGDEPEPAADGDELNDTVDREPKVRRQKMRRPSRHTAKTAAIAASRLEGAWA
ncbi:hypothetical protein ABZ671_01265 [Micromonospora sp. NPDC006766]|uniref:hypothetical protein n=1 Tax=Micromonospora sp. NPDC006766 TaxID=3154778 RepID=UPI0034042B34